MFKFGDLEIRLMTDMCERFVESIGGINNFKINDTDYQRRFLECFLISETITGRGVILGKSGIFDIGNLKETYLYTRDAIEDALRKYPERFRRPNPYELGTLIQILKLYEFHANIVNGDVRSKIAGLLNRLKNCSSERNL